MANPYKNTGKAGSPAHFIGPIGKAFVKGAKAFANTAKQYLNISKGNKPFWPTTRNTGDLYANARKRAELNQQTARNIKPFHRDGKTYSREDINDAFKKRFSKEAVPNKEILKKNKPSAKDMGLTDASKINREAPDPSQWTNFGRPDATVKMKDVMKKSGQYPKSDPFRGGR